jgi:hypothetical protein
MAAILLPCSRADGAAGLAVCATGRPAVTHGCAHDDMSERLGRHFHDARLAAGLAPGELAVRAGWDDPARGGDWVARFERTGVGSDRDIARLGAVLGIAPATVTELEGAERTRARAAWEAEASQPCEVECWVHPMPTQWSRLALPADLRGRDQVLAWLRSHPQWSAVVRCVVWDDRHRTFIHPDGSCRDVERTFGDEAGPAGGRG